MTKHLIYYLIIFSSLIVCSTSKVSSQNLENEPLKIMIEQNILPGPNPKYIYVLKNDSLSVLEKTEYYLNNTYHDKTTPLFATHFDKDTLSKLYKILDIVNSLKLDTAYAPENFVIDGVNWEIEVNYKGQLTKTYLNNCILPTIERLLKLINSELPVDKRLIEFDIMGKLDNCVENKK